MSDQLSESPIIGSPLSGNPTASPPSHQLESYFQAKTPLAGSGDCSSCCDEEAFDSPGHTLPETFKDACLQDEGLTLLARLGCKLAAFKGTGVVFINKGKATLRDAVPLKVRQLWHRFVDYHGSSVPAEPKPAPFLAIADNCGEIHAMGGLTEGTSALVHTKANGGWEAKDTGYFPKDHIGGLHETPCIQLTGYRPLDALGTEEVRRDLEALKGTGVILMSQMQAPPSTCGCGPHCCCETQTQTVAKVLPYPTGEGPWVLCYNGGEVSWELKQASEQNNCCCCCSQSLPSSILGNSE